MPDEQARPDARSHVSADRVSDLLEGLLPTAEAAAVAAHLSDCAQCAALRDDLEAMPALLAAVRVDDPLTPMPAHVADRLDRALAEVAQQRDPAPADQTRAADVVPLARARRARKVFAGLAAAAAVVVGFVVVGDVVGGGSEGDNAEVAGGGSDAATDRQAEEGTLTAPEQAAALAELSRQTFGDDAARVLAGAASAAEPRAERDGALLADEPACRPAELRAADISGTPGPVVLLDDQPVTLVTSGPRDARLVVAYRCAGDVVAEQARAVVDLTD